MAITINGSTNSITGLANGGLPDGCILDADINGMAASKLSGALPAISGASLTGIAAGITMAQAWRLNSAFSGEVTPITGWTKYTENNASNFGGDMVESSGIFTFPSTGFYMIETQGYHYGSNANTSTCIFPRFTTNNSTYLDQTKSYTNVPNLSGYWYSTSYNKHFFDVTNVSTHKCRIDSDGNSEIINGDGTLVRFIRLADT